MPQRAPRSGAQGRGQVHYGGCSMQHSVYCAWAGCRVQSCADSSQWTERKLWSWPVSAGLLIRCCAHLVNHAGGSMLAGTCCVLAFTGGDQQTCPRLQLTCGWHCRTSHLRRQTPVKGYRDPHNRTECAPHALLDLLVLLCSADC
jgi:hypothetical protein